MNSTIFEECVDLIEAYLDCKNRPHCEECAFPLGILIPNNTHLFFDSVKCHHCGKLITK